MACDILEQMSVCEEALRGVSSELQCPFRSLQVSYTLLLLLSLTQSLLIHLTGNWITTRSAALKMEHLEL